MISKTEIERIRRELGDDAKVALSVMNLLVDAHLSAEQIASRLGLDLLEAERLMAKLERIGLVS